MKWFTAIALTLAALVGRLHSLPWCQGVGYHTTFVPACDPADLNVLWPDYEDNTSFYKCTGIHRPIRLFCPSGLYFNYVFQRCDVCEQYTPAIECELLRTQNPPKCYSIDVPRPHYRTTTWTPTTTTRLVATTTSRPLTTARPSTIETQTTTESMPLTTTTATTRIPPPPMATTRDPNSVLYPPTPAPTPPSVQVVPPTLAPYW